MASPRSTSWSNGDQGGEAVKRWLATSRVRERVRLVDLGDSQGREQPLSPRPGALPRPVADSTRRGGAVVGAGGSGRVSRRGGSGLGGLSIALAREPDVLALVAHTLANAGVAGETRVVKLLYLVVVSRLPAPAPSRRWSKGPSSGGKSYTVERVLDLFPEDGLLRALGDERKELWPTARNRSNTASWSSTKPPV